MIKVSFEEPTDPDWIEWRKDCEDAQTALNDSYEHGAPESVSDLYKSQSNVYLDLDGPFHGKCAYCETVIREDHPGDTEHFRPKQSVHEVVNGKICKAKVTNELGEPVPHTGYYWLAYDWRNLLPACEYCNRTYGKRTAGEGHGKWWFFPVRSFRASEPGEESKEEPLLLHPVDDDPSKHLSIDETGVFTADSDRGQACIDMFGLNIRAALVKRRKGTYTEVENMIFCLASALHFGSTEKVEEYLDDLEAWKAGRKYHSAAARVAIMKDTERLAPLLKFLKPAGEA